jgi:hypothetical protein
MKLQELLESEAIKFYNVTEWKKAARQKKYTITGPDDLAGAKAKQYQAWKPGEQYAMGSIIDWGQGHCEGLLT